MSLTSFSLRELLQNGVHFGHKAARRNPNMAPYVYGDKNGISIIDLAKTKFLLRNALEEIKSLASRNGRILFVGTKDQASSCIEETATSCNQFFINHRWLGGTLTNWDTVSSSIKTLENLEKRLEIDGPKLTKKEYVDLEAKVIKLRRVLGGIREMQHLPHMLFIVDAQKERLAVLEAKKLGIPVVAMVDTNTDPTGVDYIIPANDDSKNSIQLICRLIQGAVLEGLQDYYDNQKIAESKAEKEKAAVEDNKVDAHDKAENEPIEVKPKDKPQDKAQDKPKDKVQGKVQEAGVVEPVSKEKLAVSKAVSSEVKLSIADSGVFKVEDKEIETEVATNINVAGATVTKTTTTQKEISPTKAAVAGDKAARVGENGAKN